MLGLWSLDLLFDILEWIYWWFEIAESQKQEQTTLILKEKEQLIQ